jgi:hypothetical protein
MLAAVELLAAKMQQLLDHKGFTGGLPCMRQKIATGDKTKLKHPG